MTKEYFKDEHESVGDKISKRIIFLKAVDIGTDYGYVLDGESKEVIKDIYNELMDLVDELKVI